MKEFWSLCGFDERLYMSGRFPWLLISILFEPKIEFLFRMDDVSLWNRFQ